MPKPFYILACDGGGIRGLATASFLFHMSKHLKTINPDFKLYDFFDMYAGTSIGAIITTLLVVCKANEDEVMEVFNKCICNEIYDKSIWDKMVDIIQHQPKYDGKGKTNVIERYVKDHKFKDCDKYMVIPTYNITEQRTQIFDSTNIGSHILTSQVVDASSAGPAYFPPVKIKNCNTEKNKDCWFVDGGMVANNPTICAISKAKKLLDGTGRKVIVLNVGTGLKTRYIDGDEATHYGGVEWLLHDILGIAMDESVIHEQATNLLSDHCYICINGKLEEASDSTDDCSDENIENLKKLGEKWWNENKHKFDNFFTPTED